MFFVRQHYRKQKEKEERKKGTGSRLKPKGNWKEKNEQERLEKVKGLEKQNKEIAKYRRLNIP